MNRNSVVAAVGKDILVPTLQNIILKQEEKIKNLERQEKRTNGVWAKEILRHLKYDYVTCGVDGCYASNRSEPFLLGDIGFQCVECKKLVCDFCVKDSIEDKTPYKNKMCFYCSKKHTLEENTDATTGENKKMKTEN